MSIVVFHRRPRTAGPKLPSDEIVLQEPPELPTPKKPNYMYMLYMLPMMLGMSMSGLAAFRPGGSGSFLALLGPGMMGLSMVGMGLMMTGRNSQGSDSTPTDRRDYLRYLTATREEVRSAIDRQRRAVNWQHPAPGRLYRIAGTDRMWERRVDDDDFCRLRVGLGSQRLAITLTPPRTRPIEDLEPLSAISLRRFIEAHQTVGDLPISVALRRFSKVLLRGDGDAIDAMVRSMLCQLATLHSPSEVRIVVCATDERQETWSWLKWLPHAHHPTDVDGAGRARLFYESMDEVEVLLGLTGGVERPPFRPDLVLEEGALATVVVLDGVPVASGSRLSAAGLAGVSVIDVGGTFRPESPDGVVSLEVTPDALRRYRNDELQHLGRPDSLREFQAAQLAKRIAGFEPSATGEQVDDSPLQQDLELPDLLGIDDVTRFDPAETQRHVVTGSHLEVPLGVRGNGTPLALNLREGALGGAGPHGMLVGATGSGKSELLRTLLLSLAATHSPDILNLVLVDFKGGATFQGCEDLPHTSAVITNLADELTLVDRMQDAIHGELIRRQEELRRTGYASLHDYEQARASGTPLRPMPSLLLIIDEFSELLSAKREFADLFIMVGRLGRSLGVHLLLATQRLDEGRVHELLSHLSYRIGLRMFSSSESRSVLGTTAAYEEDLSAGNGYLRADNKLERFKAAYVSARITEPASGPLRVVEIAADPADRVVPFTHTYLAPRRPDSRTGVDEIGPAHSDTGLDPGTDRDGGAIDVSAVDTVYSVMLDRLSGVGSQARRIWLPPLDEPSPLSSLLPEPKVSPAAGLHCGRPLGLLRTPIGVIDNPFEQRYDVLVGDLSGAGGHVAVVGAPQSGKSTLLSTLMVGLSLSHTPRQLQFYCLDFGGGLLGSLRNLPHVGEVATRQDREKVARTVAEVSGLLDRREARFESAGIASIEEYRQRRADGEFGDDPFGDDVVLVIDGWETFHADFDDVEEHVPRLVSSGLGYGIHVAAATNRWNEFRPWFRDNAGTRFELRMGDRIDSLIDTRAAGTVPKIPGRGLAEGGRHYLTALPRLDQEASTDGLAEATHTLVDEIGRSWAGPSAPMVRRLPTTIAGSELPPPEGGGDKRSDLRLPIGIEGDEMGPAWVDLGANPHLLVVGDAGSGKSNALALVAQAITASAPPHVGQIVLADYRRTLHPVIPDEHRLAFAVSGPSLREMAEDLAQALVERVPGSDVSPERLADRDWWDGKKVFVLVDDYDLLASGSGSPLEPFLDLLASGPEIGFHLIIARAAAGVGRAMMDPVWRRLVEMNTPMLLLSCPKEEGMVAGVRAESHRPGRGRLIQGRSAPLVQVATTSVIREERVA